MLCKFIREMEINVSRARDDIKVAAVARIVHGVTRYFIPSGTIYESPKAAFFVQQGCAVPVDKECEIKADRTPEQMAEAQRSMDRLQAHIDPEDFDKFDRGEITGYEMDGSYKKGPNWKEPEANTEEEW